MTSSLNLNEFLLATVDDLCALARLAPKLIESIDSVMEIIRGVNEFKREELKQLAAYYPSLILCFENNPEVYQQLISQLLKTALEDLYVLRYILFTPAISVTLTKDQSHELQSHIILCAPTQEEFANTLKDERFAQFITSQSHLPDYSRAELLCLLSYQPSLLQFLYHRNALRGSISKTVKLYQYFDKAPDSVLELLKDDVFIEDTNSLFEPASRLMTLIKKNDKSISLILENPRLAIHLRSFDLLKIYNDFPSYRMLIDHSPILLEKMRFDFPALPNELKLQISKYLPELDLDGLAKTSYSSLMLFKPHLITNQLLNHVVLNHSTQVVNLLSKYGDLIYRRGKVEDSAGRIFNNISAFEYAVWAHDSSMLAKMLTSVLPGNRTHVHRILRLQYKEMMTSGVSYILEDKVITESHISWSTL